LAAPKFFEMETKKIPWDTSKGRPEPIAALNKIPEIENGDPLVNLKVVAPSIKILRAQAITYCRLTVANMVERAAQSLPEGYFLGLIEGWRPIERQQRIFNYWLEGARAAFPGRSHQALRRTACRWAAPTDQKAPPGHCTGAALDVHLVNAKGRPYDVVSPYRRFVAARTYTLGLTKTAQINRNILIEAMLNQGFSNCRDEWWHYSFGDAGWAVRLAQPTCFYGLVRLDPHLYEDTEKLWIRAMLKRPNPFLNLANPSLETQPEDE